MYKELRTYFCSKYLFNIAETSVHKPFGHKYFTDRPKNISFEYSNPKFNMGFTFLDDTVDVKTVLCKGFVFWKIRGSGNQPLKYTYTKLNVQNKQVQYIHIQYTERCLIFSCILLLLSTTFLCAITSKKFYFFAGSRRRKIHDGQRSCYVNWKWFKAWKQMWNLQMYHIYYMFNIQVCTWNIKYL
jgi:hypothetical protein